MARELDKIIVVDVESTCDEPQPSNFVSEIIEVGIAIVDVNKLQIEKTDSIFIKPQFSQVTPFCTKLTTLTQEQVDQGMSFSEACRKIKKEYNSLRRTWASYGDYDRVQFERNAELYSGLKSPFGRTHINVKNLMGIGFAKNREEGMPRSVQHFGMVVEGTHHRGIDDAHNIAKVLIEILKKIRA